jgi:hypothetical protein
MPSNDIQIFSIRLDQIRYEAKSNPFDDPFSPGYPSRFGRSRISREADNLRYKEEMREWKKRSRKWEEERLSARARNVDAVIHIKNSGVSFHTVSLIAYGTQGGVIKESREIAFGQNPSGGVAERVFHIGESLVVTCESKRYYHAEAVV